MGLGTNQVTTTTADKFIPEMWQDETTATYQKNLVLANLVITIDHTGKKGDTVHVPSAARSAAANIFGSQGSLLSFQVATETDFTITINQHWYNAKQIPDVVAAQTLSTLRPFYTKDLGYSLSKAIDSYLWTTARSLAGASQDAGVVIGSDGTTVWNPAAATNTGNGAALTDTGIRRVIQTLDDIDVPGTERVLVIPPVEKNRLLGISRFTEQAFVGEAGSNNSIRNGYVGEVYGIPVYVSSNSPQILATDASTAYRLAILMHKESMVLVNQMKPRVQAQMKLEALSDILVADCLFGAGIVKTTNTGTTNDNTLDRGRAIMVPV